MPSSTSRMEVPIAMGYSDMSASHPAQYGLRWVDDNWGGLNPSWTVSPDVDVIKALAARNLPSSFADIEVSFFAEGLLSKVYSPCSPQRYLMRVALPVE
ncbi:hypothetical protein FQN50_009488 [Emmonsiellopsis sp. PD_5]|nr:hypothetical protein FQN50_009488 [Emmonsiellopsis sp. PD_5]